MSLFGLENPFKKNKEPDSNLERAELSIHDIQKNLAEFDKFIVDQSGSLPVDETAIQEKIKEIDQIIESFRKRLYSLATEWKKNNKYDGLPKELDEALIDFYKLERGWNLDKSGLGRNIKDLHEADSDIKYGPSGGNRREIESDKELEAYADTHLRYENEPLISPDFEDKTFAFLKKWAFERMDRGVVIEGFDTKRAWEMRSHWRQVDTYKSMAGIESSRAWEIRREVFERILNRTEESLSERYGLIYSLTGLDGEESWQIRDYFLKYTVGSPNDQYQAVLESLAGLNSSRAWDMRKKITRVFGAKNKSFDMNLAESLVGIDSEEAWVSREEIMSRAGGDLENMESYVAESLVGIDSPRAWEFRKKLEPDDLLNSLALLESEEAWEEREKALKGGKFFFYLGRSLRGLDSERAWDFRTRLVKAMKKKGGGDFNPHNLPGSFSDLNTVAGKRAQMDREASEQEL